jgi:hypothetical protein
VANDGSVNGERERIDTAREVAWAALVLGVLLLAVLWRPIAHFGTHTFASADLITQATSLTRVAGPHVIANDLLPDPVLQMHPWALFNKSELAAGRAPLWNPYNSAGVSSLANYQSSPFSPFELPFYVLPFKAALIVASFAKLLALALFTHLFLRELGMGRFASLAGALMFATSGFALLLHQYPHVGAMLALPGGLYFAERVFAALERGAKRAPLGQLVGLVLVLATAALAGHPETLGYCLVVLALYCAWRAIALLRRSGERLVVLRACGALVLAGVFAAALAAIQLAPFAEYLARSSVLTVERGARLPLERANWPLQFFPNLAGTPVGSRRLAPELPAPNYEEFTTFYVGGCVLFLALAALLFVRRERRMQFFALSAGAWLLYAWNVFGLAAWLGRVTPLGLVPIHRTQPLWVPAACFLAAWSLDNLSRAQFAKPIRSAVAWVLAGACFLAVFRLGAEHYRAQVAGLLGVGLDTFPSVCTEQITSLSIAFGAGVLGVALVAASRVAQTQRMARCAVLGALLFESGALLGDYVPTVADEFVYPRTPALESLSRQVGGGRLLVLSPDTLRADTNVLYGLHMLSNYDALGLADVDRLSEHFFGLGRDNAMTLRASQRGLDLFGVEFVATKSEWIPIDTELGDVVVPRYKSSIYLLSELTPDRVPRVQVKLEQPGQHWSFRFAASREQLDALCLQLLDDETARSRHVVVSLHEVAGGKALAEREFALADLPRLPDRRLELVLEFEAQNDSKDAQYSLDVHSPDATGDAAPQIVRAPKGRGYVSVDTPAVKKDEGGPALDLAYGRRRFARLERAGEHRLWRYVGASRGRVVTSSQVVRSHEEAFERVTSSGFDARTSVVLEGLDQPELGHATAEATVSLIAETPTSQRWSVTSSSAGWFVLAQAFYPGWKARLDGAEVAVRRANYAFTALALPEGVHEIALDYEPESFRNGRAITLASLSLVVAALLVARLRRTSGEPG